MEFTRWKLGNLNRLSTRYRSIHNVLGDVLDGTRDPLGHDFQKSPFEIRSDFESLALDLELCQKKLTSLDLFQSFASYFDIGLCLDTNIGADANGQVSVFGRLKAVFVFGDVLLASQAQDHHIVIGRESFLSDHVYRGSVQPILSMFQLGLVQSLKEAFAFGISPSSGEMYIFVCSRPAPWQRLAIESAFVIIREQMKGMTNGR